MFATDPIPNSETRDERHAKMVRMMQDWVALGRPEPKLWQPTCHVCGEVAAIEVSKWPDVRFYCLDHIPAEWQ